ncbi:hypothetical protein [Actinotalea sp. K2]|uniref:hypothetical protein n=1 Tax=Actinotalea sp. K2 TaxID=2939438 RepID=UPI00201731A2|nr:hypothetical protein [Actinotalea sp. K2]MCL3860954.1 hypothetical protein [Actinotalea sp. K2]
MTQTTTIATDRSVTDVHRPRSEAHRPRPDATVLSIHGTDSRGFPVTWHVTSLADDGVAGTYLIERAAGDIRSPAVWMQAQRHAMTVGEPEVLELVRQVMFGEGPGH